METSKPEDIATPIAETTAGAVRLVTLRLTGSQNDLAKKSQHFGRYVRSFLETEVKSPFRFRQVSPTAFALNGKCSPKAFDRYTISLHDRLMEFLFGTEGSRAAQVIVFAGTEQEVAEFITEPEDKAIERSKKYLNRVLSELKEVDTPEPTAASDHHIERYAGKRPLLYRGILACPHQVMIAYAITPNANPDASTSETRPADLDLARYLSFRGEEAIDFSIRLFDKASFLLQTSQKEMQSVIFLVPIAYRSLLAHKESEQFLQNANEHPEWVRNQIFVSVFGAPPRPSTSIIQRFGTEFSSQFRTLDWQVTEPDVDPTLFLGSRLHSLTFDLHGHKSKREQLIRQFIEAASDLHSLKIRAGITGIDTPEELKLAIKGKLTYVSGNAVTAPLMNYAPPQKVDLQDLPILEPTVLESVSSTSHAA